MMQGASLDCESMMKQVAKLQAMHAHKDSIVSHRLLDPTGFGKAVVDMALGLEELLGDHIVDGILSAPVSTWCSILCYRISKTRSYRSECV